MTGIPPRRLFYCDHYTFPLPPGHRFPVAKYALVRRLLEPGGAYRFEQAPLAPPEVVSLAHDRAYVEAFLNGSVDGRVMRRIGFPWSEGLVRRTLASVGGTLSAAEEAFSAGFGGNLAGGTHHACREEGSGFCVFNDLAVAVLWLRARGFAGRAAIVDLDVHQGDGTALIFAADPDVLTASVHGEHNFPFRKQRSRVDVGLPDGTGDDEYLCAVEQVLPEILAFSPGVIFYQSGVDPLDGDRLGRLALTHAGLKERDRMIAQACRQAGIPLVITLGGGYADPIERTAEAHANTFRVAAEVYGS